MKLYALLSFLILNSVALASGNTSFTCDLILSQISNGSNSTNTQAYVHLLSDLVQNRNAITADQISVLLNQHDAVNPFDFVNINLPTEQTFAFRMAFDQILKKDAIDPIDWNAIQKEIKNLLNRQESKEATRAEVKAETADVVYPFIKFRFPKRYEGNQGSPFGLGYWKGKPVLVGHFTDSKAQVKVAGSRGFKTRSKDDEFMFDPSTKKIERLAGKEIEGRPFFAPRYLSLNGRDYFYRLGFSNMLYSLDLKKNIGLKGFNLEVPDRHLQNTGFIFNDHGIVKAIRRMVEKRQGPRGNTSTFTKLILSNLTNPSVKSKIIKTFRDYGAVGFGVDYIDDRPILSYIHYDSNKVFFYDLKNQKAYPPLSIKLDDKDCNYAAVYQDGEKLRGIFPAPEGYAIANIEEGKILKPIRFAWNYANHGRIRVMKLDGRLIAYASISDGRIILIDLKTRALKFIDARDVSSDVATFVFKNQNYLVWGTSDGSIEIYNANKNSMVSSRKLLNDKIYQVLPFEQDGKVYALVAQWDESPQIIQLAGPLK